MGVCAFMASGVNFDVDRYLESSPFKATVVFRKGEMPAKDYTRPDSGFVMVVSEDPGTDPTQKIRGAVLFLVQHEKELDRLRDIGAEHLLLDVGFETDDKLQHTEFLPPELIAILTRFRMGLAISAHQFPRG